MRNAIHLAKKKLSGECPISETEQYMYDRMCNLPKIDPLKYLALFLFEFVDGEDDSAERFDRCYKKVLKEGVNHDD